MISFPGHLWSLLVPHSFKGIFWIAVSPDSTTGCPNNKFGAGGDLRLQQGRGHKLRLGDSSFYSSNKYVVRNLIESTRYAEVGHIDEYRAGPSH